MSDTRSCPEQEIKDMILRLGLQDGNVKLTIECGCGESMHTQMPKEDAIKISERIRELAEEVQ